MQQAVAQLTVGCIAIVIAHRLSTARALSRILGFAGGRIIGDGAHDRSPWIGNSQYRRLFEWSSGTVAPEIAP